MSNFKITKALPALTAAIMLSGMAACSDDDIIAPEQPTENSIPGQDVGIRNLKVSLPRLSRFDKVVNHVSCRIHLKGKKDRVTFPVNTFLSADKDSIYIEADDPILAELPHQMYHLNYVTFPDRSMTRSEDKEVSEDTIFVGARLSIENPDDIKFRSSFNVGANSIGSGTEEDPWIIASGDDFMLRISDPMTRGETHDGKFFEITRNLNLNTAAVTSGKGWEPAGHNNINGGSTDFNGTIDGCDNYIENLYCYTDAGCGGLFYSLGEKAYIHNLEMRRVMLIGNSDLGAFACTSKKGCRLDSIEVNGTIEGKVNVGGLIGNGDADIRVCISSVDIVSPDAQNYIGGMIGRASHASFTDCLRTGRIDAPNAMYVGGYLGGGGRSSIPFTRCYVSGSISGQSNVGGFAGACYSEFTACHAGATLPQDSYAYTLQWDIFGINNRMTPMPLEVEGMRSNVGGFVGTSNELILHGENSFAYSSPAKPNIVSNQNGETASGIGALAGYCNYQGEPGAKFTSYAYVKGDEETGGIIGSGVFKGEGTFINYGNVVGGNCTGGVIGMATGEYLADTFKINCKNTGNVQGNSYVGGIIGDIDRNVDNALMENDGNVEGKGERVGGLFGNSNSIDLAEGSHVSNENGSLKISGTYRIGGISGCISAGGGELFSRNYCPVYANIISSAGQVGGLFGEASVGGNHYSQPDMFDKHYPVRVSITVTGGDNAGGAIGLFVTSDDHATINGFDDKLQASITTSGNIAGGIVGRMVRNRADARIRDCHSFTTITSNATSEVSGFGGIVGWVDDTPESSYKTFIDKCSFHGSLSGANMTAAGGITGFCGTNLYITTSYNAGRVDAVQAVGGIVGRINGTGSITDCFNMGEVPSGSGRTWLAGIIGQKEDNAYGWLTIEQCYNVGNTGWGIIGGEKGSTYIIKNCYYLDSASNGDMANSGSVSKTADELRRNSTYNGWTTSNWELHEGVAAPTLAGLPMFNKNLPLQK